MPQCGANIIFLQHSAEIKLEHPKPARCEILVVSRSYLQYFCIKYLGGIANKCQYSRLMCAFGFSKSKHLFFL